MSSKEFKSITRDVSWLLLFESWFQNNLACSIQMCVRINNIHTMINIFGALEEHLYSCMRTAVPKPISAFGYVSSDPGELSLRPMTDKSMVSNPHHTLPENETTSEGPASVRSARRGMLTLLLLIRSLPETQLSFW